MAEGGNDKQVLDLFTKHSNHRNITVIYLSQDMFPREKYPKTINRQEHYIVAFKSPRDKLGLKNLLLQAFANRWKDVMEVFDIPSSDRSGTSCWIYIRRRTIACPCLRICYIKRVSRKVTA